MADETEIKTKDLLFYPSAQLNQNDDGGGQLVKTPLTDATSEVFDPTSSVQKVNGGFTARLVYPAVLTEGREKLLGSFCAVSRIPDQENEDVLLFAGDYYGEEWKNAKNRIEAYSVPTIFSKMTLLGYANKGTKQIQFYQRTDEAEPNVGETYCLRLRTDKATLEYFKIAVVSSEIRTFEDSSGAFQKKVINITCTDILNADWQGVDYPVRGQATPTTMCWETHISDASHYYGIARITQDINQGSKDILVNRIYGQIVPCTSTNQAHGDQYLAANNFYLPLGRKSGDVRNKGDLYFSHGILPTTYLQQSIYDNGKGQWVHTNGFSLDIDYAQGIVYNANDYRVSAQLAVLASNSAYSCFIDIDATNQQTEWAIFLDPYPARGSVHISWRSGGEWFDLAENGDRKILDSFNTEKGTVSRDGSVIFSLPDLPDAYSQIVIFWTPEEFFRNFKGSDLESNVSAETLSSEYIGLRKNGEERAIVPNTITIKSGTKTATDDGQGNIVGDFTGTVEYGEGFIQVKGMNSPQAKITCQRYKSPMKIKQIQPQIEGDQFWFYLNDNVARGSLSALLVIAGITTANSFYKKTTSQQVEAGVAYHRHRDVVLSTTKKYKTIYQTSEESATYQIAKCQVGILTDDGEGGLFFDGRRIVGEINYQLGAIFADLRQTGSVLDVYPDPQTQFNDYTLKRIRQAYATDWQFNYDVRDSCIAYVSDTATENDEWTIDTGLNTFNLLKNAPEPCSPLFNSWTFRINNKLYYENRGVIYDTYNVATGLSGEVGSIDSNGLLTLKLDTVVNSIEVLTGIYCVGTMETTATCGRTTKAPVVPQSFNCRVWTESGLKTATSTAEGTLEGDGITGVINYDTGFFVVKTDDFMMPNTLKYNCSSIQYIPVNRSIIGVDTVRFRNDGKTQILRAGDTVLIYDRKEVDLGSAFTVGTICDLGRTGLDRVAVRDAKGMRIPADYYNEDLNGGKITFNSSLNLTGFVMPLHAITSKEELNRIVKCDYSGAIELQNPVSRGFPADGDLFISSCLVQGDLESQFTTPFSQTSWTNVWSDTRIGNELLAKLNVVDYPIEINNDGAITQRWLIQFTSKTQFNIIGENIGLAGQSDTLQDCEPINPATQKPYFKIKKEAFTAANGSSLWASGNCIRFNTTATNFPLWLIKTVQPVEHDQTSNLERTQFEVLFAGDSIIPE